MKAAVFVVVCFVAVTADVLRFKPRDRETEDANSLLKFLLKSGGRERFRSDMYFHKQGIKKFKLQSFEWKSCASAKQTTVNITQLDFKPDPIQLPGTLSVEFSFNNTVKIGSPFKASVVIKKKVLGSWIEIPCIDQFGSCNYDDFCQILSTITYCPDPFTEHHISCYCPIDVGTFSLPYTDFEVDITLPLVSGDYFAMFNATANTKFGGCYEIYFTIVE